jgi:hypothetical protein
LIEGLLTLYIVASVIGLVIVLAVLAYFNVREWWDQIPPPRKKV